MEETPNSNPKTHTTTSSSAKTHINNSLSLNKASFKISKAMPNRNPSTSTVAAAAAAPATADAAATATADAPPQPNQPSQPPVYNIDKNNFRDVVQKLTGSPAHRPMPPPQLPQAAAAAVAARPPSSRLHRNRPPPLAAPRPEGATAAPAAAATSWLRPPLSPLPPFPTVSAAAESPITAYLRRLHSAPLLSPQGMAAAQPQSPLGFGCVPSPLSGYLGPLFPTSPGLPMPSPKWGDM